MVSAVILRLVTASLPLPLLGRTHFPKALGTQLLSEDWSKAFFSIPHGFMGELKATQQEKLGNIAKTHFVAKPTQQYLKHDVGGHFYEVERSSSPFIETALALAAPKHLISQFCSSDVHPQLLTGFWHAGHG